MGANILKVHLFIFWYWYSTWVYRYYYYSDSINTIYLLEGIAQFAYASFICIFYLEKDNFIGKKELIRVFKSIAICRFTAICFAYLGYQTAFHMYMGVIIIPLLVHYWNWFLNKPLEYRGDYKK